MRKILTRLMRYLTLSESQAQIVTLNLLLSRRPISRTTENAPVSLGLLRRRLPLKQAFRLVAEIRSMVTILGHLYTWLLPLIITKIAAILWF